MAPGPEDLPTWKAPRHSGRPACIWREPKPWLWTLLQLARWTQLPAAAGCRNAAADVNWLTLQSRTALVAVMVEAVGCCSRRKRSRPLPHPFPPRFSPRAPHLHRRQVLQQLAHKLDAACADGPA
eukprot:365324-Chlamydomonas_euryale.AAC.2